jgi:sugar/nucleoside kinase (ribokinase family)
MAGIACAGHWVVDHIKMIDYWPQKTELCNIESELICNGGAPFNVLSDIANLKTHIPLYGIGCIGNDPVSQHILRICKQRKINTNYLHSLAGHTTSYTDVMTIEKTGVRTMFHYHGANRFFTQKHVPIKKLQWKRIKFFYLGHLLLMDALEEPNKKFNIAAAKLLHDVKKTKMETIVDVATEHSAEPYQRVVIPCLPYIDHFVINELEAEKISGIKIRLPHNELSQDGLKKAAKKILDLGVQKNVVLHMPEGAFWLTKDLQEFRQHSLTIPPEQFIATCGAGDAFCSGIIVGLYKKWPIPKILKLATATAAASISSIHNSAGIKPLPETLALFQKYAN